MFSQIKIVIRETIKIPIKHNEQALPLQTSDSDFEIGLIIGIIVGAFLLFVINIGTSGLEDFPFTNPTVPLAIVFGAFVTMVTLGTLIGLIPAERAVSIKPIEALREE